MKIIQPSWRLVRATHELEEVLEAAGRVCYKSEDKICEGSAAPFVSKIRSMNHESVLEHGLITMHITCDRGVSHELVRHRIASFSQESTRYCNYEKGKFGGEITVIDPSGAFPEMTSDQHLVWINAMSDAETHYLNLIASGVQAQLARDVLPNSLKTEIIMSANPREWKHIFKLRAAKAAHPQMRQIMVPMAMQFHLLWPSIFDPVEV